MVRVAFAHSGVAGGCGCIGDLTVFVVAPACDAARGVQGTVVLEARAKSGVVCACGRVSSEIVPLTLKKKGVKYEFQTDEHPRPTTLEILSGLRPVFKSDGLVTAGNASGICDGAASLIVAEKTWADERGLTPIARLVGWGISGCDPTLMGFGPVPATRRAFQMTGLDLDDMALVEVNEAFAAQALAVERELGLDPFITNVNGGAIALGHPLAASGARITGTLIHELRRQGKQYGLGTACIGGGQGIAVIVEAIA